MARARLMLMLTVAVSVSVGFSVLRGAEVPIDNKAASAELSRRIQAVQDTGTAQAALDALNKGLAAFPDNARILSAYIRKAVDLGSQDDAFRQAMLLNYLDPSDGLAWGVVAHVHASRGDLAMACSDIATAVSLLPKDPFIQRTAGELLALYDANKTRADLSDSQKEMMERTRYDMAWQKPFVDAYRNAKMALAVADRKPDLPPEPATVNVPQVIVPQPAVPQPIVAQPEIVQPPAEEPPVILPGQKKPILIGTPMGGDIQPPVIVNNNYYQYTPPVEFIDPYWPGYGWLPAYSSWYQYGDPLWVFVPPIIPRPCPRPYPPYPYPPRPYPPRPHPMPVVATGGAVIDGTQANSSASTPGSGYSKTVVSGLSAPIVYNRTIYTTSAPTYQSMTTYSSSGFFMQGTMSSGGGGRRR